MRCLDLFCCQGGAGMGYSLAGFEVVGVDISPQPKYPFEFHQADAIEFLRDHGHEFDFIHASPPCQGFSTVTPEHARAGYANLITATREVLLMLGKPYVIENVVGAAKLGPMRRDLMLCGEMFGLRVIRHRIFETNLKIDQPDHLKHRGHTKGAGRRSRGTYSTDGYYYAVYGQGTDKGSTSEWQEAMGIHWTTDRHSIAEAIPPAYTQYIGQQVLKQL